MGHRNSEVVEASDSSVTFRIEELPPQPALLTLSAGEVRIHGDGSVDEICISRKEALRLQNFPRAMILRDAEGELLRQFRLGRKASNALRSWKNYKEDQDATHTSDVKSLQGMTGARLKATKKLGSTMAIFYVMSLIVLILYRPYNFNTWPMVAGCGVGLVLSMWCFLGRSRLAAYVCGSLSVFVGLAGVIAVFWILVKAGGLYLEYIDDEDPRVLLLVLAIWLGKLGTNAWKAAKRESRQARDAPFRALLAQYSAQHSGGV